MYPSGITQRGAQWWLAGGWFLPGNPAKQQMCGHSSMDAVALLWHWCARSTEHGNVLQGPALTSSTDLLGNLRHIMLQVNL